MYCHCFFLVSGKMNDKLPPFKEITYTAGAFYRILNIDALNYPNYLMKSALLLPHFADEETGTQRVRKSPKVIKLACGRMVPAVGSFPLLQPRWNLWVPEGSRLYNFLTPTLTDSRTPLFFFNYVIFPLESSFLVSAALITSGVIKALISFFLLCSPVLCLCLSYSSLFSL